MERAPIVIERVVARDHVAELESVEFCLLLLHLLLLQLHIRVEALVLCKERVDWEVGLIHAGDRAVVLANNGVLLEMLI